ncbi:hypothetical protein QN277_007777 [Acacia crassicarpa]|uniref:Uncharacterized protein n=1 Tax=Acacia crassicarpa TaxID=499986 RepID=A0AAE1JS61_9FABA|nr:hypothetical protein QN277_007777 [Acacia crassicarpa]
MLDPSSSAMNDQLSRPNSIFGLRLWVVLGACDGAAIVLLIFLISIWLISRRSKTETDRPSQPSIHEIRIDHHHNSKLKENPDRLVSRTRHPHRNWTPSSAPNIGRRKPIRDQQN